MRTPFGPFYVTPLQRVIDHAERVVGALEALERDVHAALLRSSFFDDFEGPSDDAVWIIGRAGEVVAMVEDVAREWRERIVSAEEAARVLERYLGGLHEGMSLALKLARPACCAPSFVTPACIESDDPTTRITATRVALTPAALTPIPETPRSP